MAPSGYKPIEPWGTQLGIGVDVESVNRFRHLKSAKRLFSKAFTVREMDYCMSKADPPMHFAGTFAAKEAAFKSVGIFQPTDVATTDFEIFHGMSGVPVVKYLGSNPRLREVEIRVSVSHTTQTAVAVAISNPHGESEISSR